MTLPMRDGILPAAPSAAFGAGAGVAWPLLALVLGAAAMGVSPIFVRLVSGEIGPVASAFWRVALALPLLYGWMRVEERGSGHAGEGRIGGAALLAGAAFAGDLFFWHLSILGTTVANATFFATTAPVFVVLITWLGFGLPIGRGTLIGLALCLGGGAALLGQSLSVAPGRLVGDLYGLVTAVFFGIYLLAMSRAREQAGAARVTLVSSLVTAAILLVVALALDGDRIWPSSPGAWSALIALAVISHAGGQGLLAVALGRLPTVFSSLVIFLEAVFAAAAGWGVLGEALTLVQALGGALILSGLWAAQPTRPEGGAT